SSGGKDVLTTDGTTATSRGVAAGAGGRSMAVFKNRVWVTGFDDIPAATIPRVSFSALGDATVWNVPDFVDVREKDGKMPICFGAAGGGGLLVFKKGPAYKITH